MPFKLIYNLVHFSGNYRSYIMPTDKPAEILP